MLERFFDDVEFERITKNAYRDLIISDKYTYRTFIKSFDAFLEDICGNDVGTTSDAETFIWQADKEQKKLESEFALRWKIRRLILDSLPMRETVKKYYYHLLSKLAINNERDRM